mgnify:CR=1 FL=1
MSDKNKKYRVSVSLVETEFVVDAVDDLDAEEQVNRIMSDGYDIWTFDEIEPLDLLNDTIKEYMEIPDMPNGRPIDTSRCLTNIHTAFTKLIDNG